jgi:hypothetical protein
MAVKDDPG